MENMPVKNSREIWIYSEASHTDSSMVIISAEVCSISEFEEEEKKKPTDCSVTFAIVIPTDVKNIVSPILPSLCIAFRLRLCNVCVKHLISTQPLRKM